MHNVVPMHKSTLRKGVHKCIRLRSALLQGRELFARVREELTGVRRADRSTAVLSARPRPGFDGDAHRAARAQGDEHVALPT